MRPAQLDRTGKESPKTHGRHHWTHRMPWLIVRGEDRPGAKLTPAAVVALRLIFEHTPNGMRRRALRAAASVIGISVSLAYSVARGRAWRHIP